jgi:hypothetical protein
MLTFRKPYHISETQMEALPKSRHETQLVDRLQESLVAAESQSKRNFQFNLFSYLGPDPKVNVADIAPNDRYRYPRAAANYRRSFRV